MFDGQTHGVEYIECSTDRLTTDLVSDGQAIRLADENRSKISKIRIGPNPYLSARRTAPIYLSTREEYNIFYSTLDIRLSIRFYYQTNLLIMH